MTVDSQSFFQNIIGAGALLSGFCGTFLSFRIQREANYYRQPALSFEKGEAKDIFIGRTHFSSAFLLLILATLCATVFGFVFPLFALAGKGWWLARVNLVVAGLIASLVLVGAYFCSELVHYEIVSNRLLNDKNEWGRERRVVIAGITLAVFVAAAAYLA